MDVLDCGTFRLGKAPADKALELWAKPSIRNNVDYLIAETGYRNTAEIGRLMAAGGCFHDRIMGMEIHIASSKRIREIGAQRSRELIFCETAEISEEMIQKACEVFTEDRRFHLELSFDLLRAERVLRAYIEKYQAERCRILCAEYRGRIAGYTMIRNINDQTAENVLGVTEPTIVGKTAAFGLYCSTLDHMESWGYKKYFGCVSSANAASLNLHIQLGARITEITDQYMLRRH